MKHILFLLFFIVPTVNINAQNVGIGMSDPQYKLDVQGTCYIRGNSYVSGFVGIGTTSPIYKLDVVGSIRTTGALYANGSAYIDGNFDVDGYAVIGGTAYMDGNAEIAGNAYIDGDLDLDGSADIAGSVAIGSNLTVNGGKGILRNGHSSTQLKYYTFSAPFSFVNFSPNGVIGPVQVNFPAAAGFTSAPRVAISNYIVISGTAGRLFSIIPAVYQVTSTGFQMYFFNSSTSAATMDFTMSYICIGAGN